jgi:hypothetical protein
MSNHFESRLSLKESRDTLAEQRVIVNQQQTDTLLVGFTHRGILAD